MKKYYLVILALFTWSISFAQTNFYDFSERGELYFSFKNEDENILKALSRIISIDNVKENGEIIAYANEDEFLKFLEFGIEPTILTPPSMLEEHVLFTLNDYRSRDYNWNEYITYDTYVAMMYDFESNFPDLCQTINIGATASLQRNLLICKLTSSLSPDRKVKIHYSSTMHGDEVVGYILMLRLIDYLLNNYETSPRIKNILDNAEIWICPNANPDGTYYYGNNSLNGGRRNNQNNVDLNRNYKDDVYGNHPDGKAWQPETLKFMELQEEQHFNLAVNMHGGEEVCNYPWDNKNTLATDNDWWLYVCREYADTVHVYNSNYMNGFNNGIVRGYAWYSISGGRQDYANYYDHCREFCLELSGDKVPSAATLPNYWNWNYRSMLNYVEQGLYGIHGTVTDVCTGEPISAIISLPNDMHNAFVTTDPNTGYYARYKKAGTYSVTYSAEGYISQTHSITVTDKQKIVLNILLEPTQNLPVAAFKADQTEIYQYETVNFTNFSQNATAWEWYFEGGTPETSNEKHPAVLYENAGVFDVKLTVFDGNCNDEKRIENYITVNQHLVLPVANFEADKTEILEKETVVFTDLSQYATAWEWLFEGGIPETSTDQNPAVLYENEGVFSVKLVVANEFGTDEMLKENYIVVNGLGVNSMDECRIRIFPNPVFQENVITVEAALPVHKIELINLLGSIVKKTYPNIARTTFSINGIESGLYLMKIETEKGIYTTKVQIN